VPALARTAVLVAALTLVACGKERPAQAVRNSVQHFGKDVAAQDYTDLCKNVLADNLISALEASGVPCELALKTGLSNAKNPKLEIKTIAVNGDRALVSVHSTASNQPPSDDTLSLIKQHGKWKISSLARPQPQPPQQP
jgi:putative lumazine-binding protein